MPTSTMTSRGQTVIPKVIREHLGLHPGDVIDFVVADDGAAPPPLEDLDRMCLDHIARFKRPKDYRFVDALPTNNYGKVLKRELRDRLRAEAEHGTA